MFNSIPTPEQLNGKWEGNSIPSKPGQKHTPWNDVFLSFQKCPQKPCTYTMKGEGYSTWKGERIPFVISGHIDCMARSFTMFKTHQGKFNNTLMCTGVIDFTKALFHGSYGKGTLKLSKVDKLTLRMPGNLLERLSGTWVGHVSTYKTLTKWTDCKIDFFVIDDSDDGRMEGKGISLWKHDRIPFLLAGTFNQKTNTVRLKKTHCSERYRNSMEYSLRLDPTKLTMTGSYKNGEVILRKSDEVYEEETKTHPSESEYYTFDPTSTDIPTNIPLIHRHSSMQVSYTRPARDGPYGVHSTDTTAIPARFGRSPTHVGPRGHFKSPATGATAVGASAVGASAAGASAMGASAVGASAVGTSAVYSSAVGDSGVGVRNLEPGVRLVQRTHSDNQIFSDEGDELPASTDGASREPVMRKQRSVSLGTADDVPNMDFAKRLGDMRLTDNQSNANLTAYKAFLAGCIVDGVVSTAQLAALKSFREQQSITNNEHVQMLMEVGLDSEQFHNMQEKPKLKQQKSMHRNDICKICFDRVIDCVLLPCGHFSICSVCARTLERRHETRCPICRTVFYEAKRVYRS